MQVKYVYIQDQSKVSGDHRAEMNTVDDIERRGVERRIFRIMNQ